MQVHVGSDSGRSLGCPRRGRLTHAPPPRHDRLGVVRFAAGLGSAIEYCNFHLYAALAVSIRPLFFPNQSPETACSPLIDAPAGTLTTAENVTAGLFSVIGALPIRHLHGRRVLIAEDCFPSLHFLLSGLAHRFGFVLDTVRLRPGETYVHDEDFVARWQDDVGVALLTWVTSTASHRCGAPGLIEQGHGQRRRCGYHPRGRRHTILGPRRR